MITMDERTERRRSPLLGNPFQQRRRTLLSSDDSILTPQTPEDGAGKRRKGLLSTPETRMQRPLPNPQASISTNDFKTRKRPALLSNSPCQMPQSDTSRPPEAHFPRKSSFPTSKESKPSLLTSPTNATKLTASKETPSNQRRVLLSLSSEDKSSTPSATSTSSPLVSGSNQPGDGSKSTSRSESRPRTSQDSKQSVKTSLFEYLSSDSGGGNEANGDKKSVNKATMTDGRSGNAKSTATDLSAETDLAWLHQQRALIDKRIAELQDDSQASSEKKDLIVYISGYYCQVCRKLIRGDFAEKLAHSQEESHVLNAEASANDPETLLKYFEERYDGIAFDDDDGGEDSGTNIVESLTQKSSIDSSKLTRNGAGDDGESYVDGGTGESEDEDEQESTCERFDRTRISRR